PDADQPGERDEFGRKVDVELEHRQRWPRNRFTSTTTETAPIESVARPSRPMKKSSSASIMLPLYRAVSRRRRRQRANATEPLAAVDTPIQVSTPVATTSTMSAPPRLAMMR